MADVPDDLIRRRIEDVVERHGQLDDAQPGAEMAPRDRDRIDQLLAEFFRQLRQIRLRQLAKVSRKLYLIKQRRTVADALRRSSLRRKSLAFLCQRAILYACLLLRSARPVGYDLLLNSQL